MALKFTASALNHNNVTEILTVDFSVMTKSLSLSSFDKLIENDAIAQ
jgi:hypothetical protein